ncbi:hypothetical protein HLRTI_001200 [Halorhabdus tiamatea SARL4B]|uniref:Uncharacterized protein n=1 Tax=Halorhabdus tiamatea SARL4B TaxID=1033806 RepID=F7PHH5_9EURY|nr:hypothetical protein [Halorhabdus tiamatea]ERJ06784.1 hypothetical protein HLRTI_001200 [Halorhabdus tiamatea SARL4B]CCQ33707.1 hypothetical protein HTIA_1580 [Halorhabdus tiamatea SARL4B]
MKCPTCEFEFEPTGGLQCPRCGSSVSCSTTTCAECDACSGIVEQLRRKGVDRLRADGGTE